MSPLLKKEMRLLLVPWLIGVEAAALPFIWKAGTPLSLVCSLVAITMAAVSSFGRELSAHTFSTLLTLPVERRTIWRLKTSLLFGFFLSASVIPWFAVGSMEVPRGVRNELMLLFCSAGAAILATGLWSTLLFRQIAVSICFTILIPIALAASVSALVQSGADESSRQALAAALALLFYAIVSFGFARILFFEARDKLWTGGMVLVPKTFRGRSETALAHSPTARRWRPRAALWRKEFQLQHGTLLLAAGLAVVHLLAIAARLAGRKALSSHSVLTVLIEIVGAAWMFVPLIAGCSAIAEERRNGTLETQLCLPLAARGQLTVKFLVALLLSLLFGAVVPTALELGSTWLGARVIALPNAWEMLGFLSAAAVAISLVSFYASTLSRSTIEALAAALIMGVIGFVAFQKNRTQPMDLEGLVWPRTLTQFATPPLLAIIGAWLATRNFRSPQISTGVWKRNVVVIATSLACLFLALFTFYNRLWEFAMTLEPAHGAARFSPNDAVKFSASWRYLAARLPDSRLWIQVAHYIPTHTVGKTSIGRYENKALMLPGTNWQDVAAGTSRCVATRTDGTLWEIDYSSPNMSDAKVIQVGAETDWQTVGAGGAHFIALKRNGTLWAWGRERKRHLDVPQLLGTETNWIAVFAFEGQALAVKTDGSVWEWNFTGTKTDINEPSRIEPKPLLGFVGEGILAAAGLRNGNVAVMGNRTLTVWGDQIPAALRQVGTWSKNSWGQFSTQLSGEPVWRDVTIAYGQAAQIIGLKNDGTLWQWRARFDWDNRETPLRYDMAPLGRHSDWIAVEGQHTAAVSLAADGSVWRWSAYRGSRFDIQLPSRRPERIAMIGP